MSDVDDVSDRPAKRARPEKLIDDIADDDDDPDADDEDYDDNADEEEDTSGFIAREGEDDEVGENRSPRKSAKSRRDRDSDDEGGMHLSYDQRREMDEADQLVAAIEQKYGGDGNDDGIDLNNLPDDYDDIDEMDEGGGVGSILPSIKDPKLWLIKCDPGTEDLMVLTLMKRFVDTDPSRNQVLCIHSVFTTPASKGYIYIEAEKEAHVKLAIRGLRPIKWWKVQLLPINQMVNAVKFHEEIPEIHRGQWVRMKSGLYRGDLAKVVGLYDQNTMITVKLIPRIDMAQLGQEGRKRKRAPINYSAASRPPPALFNRDEIQDKGGDVHYIQKHPRDGRRYDTLGSNRFRHGFLYKDVRYTQLYMDNIQPTAIEAEGFLRRVKGDEDDDESDEEPEVNVTTNKRLNSASLLSIGDHVIVSEGDMKNITGRITSIDKQKLTLVPDANQPLSMAMDFMLKQVKKFFRLGDHVKVIAGVYRDETGMVTQVQPANDTLTIYSDTQNRELTVNVAEVIESSEVSTGRESLGQFSLFDLVQLSNQSVGVIIKIDVASFRVLTQRGVVQTIKLQEIGAKRHSKFAAALDSNGNQLSKDDVVVVHSGEHKGRQGTIKHIFRHFLFLFSRSVTENGGMFVVNARQVTIVGQQHLPLIGQSRGGLVPQSPHVGGGNNTTSMGPPAARARGRVGARHPMIGKNVTITGGPYKSFIGIVKDANEMTVQVELHALARKVMVSHSQVVEQGAKSTSGGFGDGLRMQESRDFFQGGQTPLLGSRTPAMDLGAATPAHERFGSQTPAYGAAQTPSRDAWAAQTPARSYREENDEDEDEADEWKHDYARTPITPNTTRIDDDDEDDDAHAPARQAPKTPITPMVRTPYGATDADEAEEASDAPLLPVGAKVSWIEDNGQARVGTIIKHNTDGGVNVRTDDAARGTSVTLSRSQRGKLRGVAPEKGDQVIVISGNQHLGDVGELLGINQNSLEAIVNFAGAILIAHLDQLCKYSKP